MSQYAMVWYGMVLVWLSRLSNIERRPMGQVMIEIEADVNINGILSITLSHYTVNTFDRRGNSLFALNPLFVPMHAY
jgi:hypothetical protein